MNENKFRVYRCRECRNVGFDRVADKRTNSQCSLCSAVIFDRPGMIYVSSVEEARRRAGILATMAQTSESRVSMGLGLRRRVLDIVESLVNMNRLKPVTLEQVLTECADAGIPRERAMHFLDVLRDENLITHDNESVMSVTS
ncbi:MAG: hypothetical protein KAU48_06115 [Candidatus Thorarchaeota archaeon]|nr:hypothetical protein [Candidatus Thorarchaeota archaeon]